MFYRFLRPPRPIYDFCFRADLMKLTWLRRVASRNLAKHWKTNISKQITLVKNTWPHTHADTLVLTEQDDDTEQYGHQSSSCEAIWEGQHLGVTGLHVSTAVASTHSHDQCTGAALNGVVIVWDHNRQEVHAHLTPTKPPPPCQDIGSVICGKMQMSKACQ